MTVVINGTTGIDTGTGSLIAADSTTPTYLDLFEDTDNGSNYVRLIAPTSVASNRTITLPDGTGTVAVNGVSGVLVSSTAQTAPFASPNTSCDFTGIPSWVKRITVVFQGVSNTSTGSSIIVQLGTSAGVTTSGYLGASSLIASTVTSQNYTTGFGSRSQAAAAILHGSFVITLVSGDTWSAFGVLGNSNTATTVTTGGSVALAGTLDRVRITSENGTDTFDAGTINIIYE